jgi:hypothetical protein
MQSLKHLKKQTAEAWHKSALQRRADTVAAVANFNLTRSRDHAEEQDIEQCVPVSQRLFSGILDRVAADQHHALLKQHFAVRCKCIYSGATTRSAC